MRRSRRLTDSERWELGFFFALLMLGCAGMAAAFQYNRIPRLFAMMFDSPSPTAQHSAPTLPAGSTPLPTMAPGLQPVASPRTPVSRPAVSPPAISLPPASIANAAPKPAAIVANLMPSLPGDAGREIRPKKAAVDIRWYKGREFRYARTIKLRVTAYAADPRCCWPFTGTTTASGQSAKTNHGRLVAADTSVIPMYALVEVPGYVSGAAVPVLDRGGKIKGRRLDVLLPSYERAQNWGVRVLEVSVYLPVKE